MSSARIKNSTRSNPRSLLHLPSNLQKWVRELEHSRGCTRRKPKLYAKKRKHLEKLLSKGSLNTQSTLKELPVMSRKAMRQYIKERKTAANVPKGRSADDRTGSRVAKGGKHMDKLNKDEMRRQKVRAKIMEHNLGQVKTVHHHKKRSGKSHNHGGGCKKRRKAG